MSVNPSKVKPNRFEKIEQRIDASKGFAGVTDDAGEVVKSYSANTLHVLLGVWLNECTDENGVLHNAEFGALVAKYRHTLKISASVLPINLDVLQKAASSVKNPIDNKKRSLSRFWDDIEAGYRFMMGLVVESSHRPTIDREEIKAAVLAGHVRLNVIIPKPLLVSEKPLELAIKPNPEVAPASA